MKYLIPVLIFTIVMIAASSVAVVTGTAPNPTAGLPSFTTGTLPGAQTPSGNAADTGITPTQTIRPRSGEVEVPVRSVSTPTPEPTRTTPQPTRVEQETPTPRPTATPPRTTVPPTPTPTSPITQRGTPTPVITQPVETVTVFVYPSGPVYLPSYYYPPGYSYPISSYYPAGSLVVTSSPTNAIVIVDGYNSETTPWVFTNMLPGYHTIEIDYPGYQPYITSVYVDVGASPEIDASLVPLQTYGSMFIDSTPQGADVYVDGNYEGTSPVTVGGIAEGPHQVELHLAGYEVLTRTVSVTAGQGSTMNLVMAPYSSSSQYGSIDISSDIPGAVIYLDGTYKGSTLSGTTFNIISVGPGSHTLLLHVPGYTDFTRTVAVSAGQITTVKAIFGQQTANVAAQAAQPGVQGTQGGSIIASSSPAGGEVYLDNQFRGVAPVTIYDVASGTHIVNMKLAGYADWSDSVSVPAGQIVPVAAVFTAGTSAAPSSTRSPLSPAIALGALAVACAGLIITRRRR
jgi:hypothetical protein